MQRLQAEVQVERVLRTLRGAQVTHQVRHGLRDIRRLAELLGIGESMVGLIRRREAGELVRMGLPVEIAAVHQAAADSRSVAIDILGR